MNQIDTADSSADEPSRPAGQPTGPELIRMPRLEEQLLVSTQRVETGRVTLTKTVQETQETVTIPLQQEAYTVERIVVNQYVEQPPDPRQEGETTIYPVLKEVLVVEKRLLLVEEIRVTRQRSQTEETQTIRLRREDITVERTPANPERPA